MLTVDVMLFIEEKEEGRTAVSGHLRCLLCWASKSRLQTTVLRMRTRDLINVTFPVSMRGPSIIVRIGNKEWPSSLLSNQQHGKLSSLSLPKR